MSEQIFLTAAVLAIAAGAGIHSFIRKKRLRKQALREKYGEIPPIGAWDEKEKVKSYYEWMKGREQEDWVDDITWNDLSMNQVFQRINSCDTSAGEEILYWRLRKNGMTPEECVSFEEKIRTFSENEKEREDVERLLWKIGKSPSSYYIPAYMDAVEEYRIGKQWVFRGLQIILAACLVFLIITQDSRGAFAVLGAAAVNLLLYTVLRMKYEIEMGMAGTAVSLLERGRDIVGRSEVRRLFPELKDQISYFRDVVRGSRFLQIHKVGMGTGDLSALILDYTLGITLCRITTYNKMIDRMSRKSEEYMAVYRQIGELDAAICIASFRESLPLYCTPEFAEDRRVFMEGVCHPLIEEPVGNTLDLRRSCLITGSNASGKSTFIKAVAVNAILAQGIYTCEAKRFVMPRARVITSMAVKDDLMAGESYFIREIRYLRRILDGLSDERTTICAIDEILRGTNTGERIRASRAILEYLRNRNCIALVATHDRELTELLEADYDNYHFSEEIGEDDICFTYQILPGPSVSHNAIKLLEFAGFPEEIIEASGEDVPGENG